MLLLTPFSLPASLILSLTSHPRLFPSLPHHLLLRVPPLPTTTITISTTIFITATITLPSRPPGPRPHPRLISSHSYRRLHTHGFRDRKKGKRENFHIRTIFFPPLPGRAVPGRCHKKRAGIPSVLLNTALFPAYGYVNVPLPGPSRPAPPHGIFTLGSIQAEGRDCPRRPA